MKKKTKKRTERKKEIWTKVNKQVNKTKQKTQKLVDNSAEIAISVDDLNTLGEEGGQKFVAELFAQHDIHDTVDRGVGHDQKVGYILRAVVHRIKVYGQVFEGEQAEYSARRLTYEKHHDEAHQHDGDVVALFFIGEVHRLLALSEQAHRVLATLAGRATSASRVRQEGLAYVEIGGRRVRHYIRIRSRNCASLNNTKYILITISSCCFFLIKKMHCISIEYFWPVYML